MARIRINEHQRSCSSYCSWSASSCGIAVSQAMHQPVYGIAGALVGLYFLFAIKSRAPVGKSCRAAPWPYVGLRGPGLCHIVPILETLSPYVDQRVRVASVSAESTLTRDTVPVHVDAIFFWMVWNAEKSILEVENFIEAINMSAQTALRESIGRHELAQMITERETMGRELQRILDEKTNPWGITVQSVEIRDVKIPPGLEDAMSRQAQAERELRQGRHRPLHDRQGQLPASRAQGKPDGAPGRPAEAQAVDVEGRLRAASHRVVDDGPRRCRGPCDARGLTGTVTFSGFAEKGTVPS